MRTVATIPASGLLAGAAVGFLLAEPPFVVCYLLLAACAAAAIIAALRNRRTLIVAAVAAGFFTGGVLLSTVAWQRAWRPPLRVAFEALARDERSRAAAAGRRMPEDDEAFAVVEGVLRSDAARTEGGVSLSLDVDRIVPHGATSLELTSGGIVVTVVGALAESHVDEWRAGRRLRFPAALRRPSRYLDPGVPDHERALARRGTTLVGTVKSGELVEVRALGSRLDEALGVVRLFARRAIADAVGRWNARSAAIVAAIVIGDRAGLDDEVQRRLQEAGTYHVIAISGGNIAILAGLLLGGFRLAGWLGRGAMLCAIAMLIAYARLVGGGASVDRATLMAVVYLGARALDHRSSPMNALALVAALLVAADPLSTVDPAFILTFGATLAILLIMPIVRSRVLSKALLGAGLMFAASVAAEAMLFPVGAALFSRITFAGLGLNFLAIPLMAIAQIAGMAVVPVALVSRNAAALVGWIAHAGAFALVRSADLVRYVPPLSYRIAPPPWLAVAGYYLSAGSWWWLWRRRVDVIGSRETKLARLAWRLAGSMAVVSALWILVDPRTLVASRGDGRLHATFLDVGQGDSTFVVFPRGSTMLVDAGGLSMSSAFDIGDRVVAPVVRQAGFRRLDLLALTHGDPDHIGGGASVVEEFRPREVWEGIPVPRSEPLTSLRTQVRTEGLRWTNVYAGDRRSIDGVEVVVRHPAVADWERQKVRNDDSIVLELRWRDVSLLLTGDVGKVPERIIAATIPAAPTRIVKIAHHGSLTSSSVEFVSATHPQIAIVSAGRSNHFGHPVPEVLDRYRSVGAEVFRTDRDGAVAVDTDGTTVDVRTFNGRFLSLRH